MSHDRRMRCRGWLALPAVVAQVLTGCGEATAVLVRFESDPALSGSAPLAPRLATLQLLLDADEGFEGLDGAQAPPGLRALDADGDGRGELLLELNVSGRDALPVVRVDAGRNAGRAVGLQARGLDDGGQLVAVGGVAARALFVAGRVTEASVPLNLVRALRPPHLVGAAPQGVPPGFVLESVAFHASRPLDASTLEGRVQVSLLLAGDAREAVPGELAAPRACVEGSEMWTLVPAACHSGGPYLGVEIVLGAGVTDLDGQALRDGAGVQASALRIDVELAGLGPCAASSSCRVHGRQGAMQGSDVVCDPVSGRFVPAACTLLREACVDARDTHAWVMASSETACQQLRPDSTLAAGGLCAVQDPWPCDHQWDCDPVDTYCNRASGQCAPLPCEDRCSDGDLACAAAGCVPRVGACVEDCSLTGSCPALGQRCLVDDDGVPGCR